MNVKPKLLILSPRFPYPLEKGDKLRLFHQIRFLQNHFTITLVSLSEQSVEQEFIQVLHEMCNDVFVIVQKRGIKIRAVLNAFFRRKPVQLSYYFENKIQKEINEIVEKIKPDAVFVQLVRMAEYAKDLEIPTVLDYMDAMSLNMAREASQKPFPFSLFYRREATLLRNAERFFSDYFDAKIIISAQDKEYLENQQITGLTVQSNGVDVDFFDESQLESEIEEKYDFAFIGNMGYVPNIEAVEFIVHHILPNFPSKKLLIAGARPHNRVLKLSSSQVDVSGWVEDIRSSYLSAKMIIAPIFTGAGQQNKILEGMALGRICVTTTQVNAAIQAKDGEQLFVADTKDQFVEKIRFILNNLERTQEVGKNARIFVAQNYNWEKQVNILVEEILSII